MRVSVVYTVVVGKMEPVPVNQVTKELTAQSHHLVTSTTRIHATTVAAN